MSGGYHNIIIGFLLRRLLHLLNTSFCGLHSFLLIPDVSDAFLFDHVVGPLREVWQLVEGFLERLW